MSSDGTNKDVKPLRNEANHFKHWILCGLVGSILLRLSLFDFRSGDYNQFLSEWYDFLVHHGRWKSLGEDFSNYPPLYLYFLSLSTYLPVHKLYAVKFISVIADYLLACQVFLILKKLNPADNRAWIGFFIVLFLPTVWFNSALWAQCDSIFTAALLATMYHLMTRRHLLAFIFYGIACALKPQAIFFAPFVFGYTLSNRLPLYLLLVPGLTYLVCGLPAILAGKSLNSVLFHYLQQENHAQLSVNAPNLYQWIPESHYEHFKTAGTLMTLLLSGYFVMLMQEKKKMPPNQWIVLTAFLSVLLVPSVLPGMHERYFYPADILSILFVFIFPKKAYIAVAVQVCSLLSYFPFIFFYEPVPLKLLSLTLFAVLCYITYLVVSNIDWQSYRPSPRNSS